MKINELYIEQTNRFCEANCKITAEDILAKAKLKQEAGDSAPSLSQADTESNKNIKITKKELLKQNGKKANKTFFRLSPVAAACLAIFILTGTTVLAFSGNFGKLIGDAGMTVVAFNENTMKVFFRDILGDEVTSELVGRGYLYEINQTQEDENYRIDVLAASGDKENAKLAVDVYVKDENLTAYNERIYLVCYRTNPGEEVNKDTDECFAFGGYGVKDETVDNLYHVLMDISSSPDEYEYHFTTVITTFSPSENTDLFVFDWLDWLARDPLWQFHPTDLRFTFAIPEEAFSHIITAKYGNITYAGERCDYTLDNVQYGVYETKATFYFDYTGDKVPSNVAGQEAYEGYIASEFISMLQDCSLTADDTEYMLDATTFNYSVSWDINGTTGPANRFYITICLPAIDYYETDNIAIRIGDETHFLKEEN